MASPSALAELRRDPCGRPRMGRAERLATCLALGGTTMSLDSTEFAGKRALVTGGTEGMGEAIVRRLAAGGATVATTARSRPPEGQAVELFVQADISTREGVDKVVREVLERLGGLDILVNNVGGASGPRGGGPGPDEDGWAR